MTNASQRYRGRFAPSPTGPLHFGSLVAAVASYLDAKHHRGEWLLRIEDLDPPREMPGSRDTILRTLEAYGFEWDSEVVLQSQRYHFYEHALDYLRQRHMLYRCKCSRQDLNSQPHSDAAKKIYPGLCRHRHIPPDNPHALRLRISNPSIEFQDRVFGLYSQSLDTEVGDFILRRIDGLYAYQLAVVVDDAEQKINNIVRGADLLDNTPRQIYLQTCLGLPQPRYMHIPIAIDTFGFKLSKQTGALALSLSTPSLLLVNALNFLEQGAPTTLAAESIRTIWDWAIANWNAARIPLLLQKQVTQ